MEEDMYMVLNDNNTIMVSRMNLENTMIFVEGYFKKYYDEPRLTVTIERMPRYSGENEDGE